MRNTFRQAIWNSAVDFLLTTAAVVRDPVLLSIVETSFWILAYVACHYRLEDINFPLVGILIFVITLFAIHANSIRTVDLAPNPYDPDTEFELIDQGNGNVFEEKLAEYLNHSRLFRHAKITKKTRGDKGGDIEVYYLNSKCIIQCKAHHVSTKKGQPRGNITGISAICEVIFAREFYGASYAAVVTNTRFSKYAVAFAESYGVFLFDRFGLESLMTNDESRIVLNMPPLVRAASGFSRIRRLTGRHKGTFRKALEKAQHSLDRIYLERRRQ